MTLIDLIGFVVSFLILLFLFTRKMAGKARERQDPDAGRRRELEHLLQYMEMDEEEAELLEEELGRLQRKGPRPAASPPPPPPPRVAPPSLPPLPPKKPVKKSFSPEYALHSSLEEHHLNHAIEEGYEKEFGKEFEDVLSSYSYDEAYKLSGQEEAAAEVTEIVDRFDSLPEMVVIHEVLSRPRALREHEV